MDRENIILQQKRRISTLICVCYSFLYGVDLTAVNVSLLYYLKDFFNPNTATQMYSIIMFVSYSTSIFAGVIGRISDKTRNLRLLMSLMLMIIGIGNLLYSLHFSIWFLIVGRFLGGLGNPLRCIIAGELTRWYTQDEFKNILFIYGTAFSFGYMLGPATAALFINVNVSVGAWHITKDNCVGIAIAFLAFVLMIATLFGVRNFSKDSLEEDRTAFQQKELQQPQLSLKDIVKDTDVVLVIVINAWLYFIAAVNELLIVMIGRNTLKMDLTHLTTSIFLSFLLYMVFVYTCWRKFFSGSNPLRGLMFCLWCGCYANVILLFVVHIEIASNITKSAVIVLASWTVVMSGVPATLAAQEILFRIVPNHSASFIDSIRGGISNGCGLAVGALLASCIFETLLQSSIMIIIILILLSIPLYKRRDVIYHRMEMTTLP